MIQRIDPENTNLPKYLIPVFLKIQDRFRRNCEPIVKRSVVVGKGWSTENLLIETKEGAFYMIPVSPSEPKELPQNEWIEMKAEEAIRRGLIVTLKFADKIFNSPILNA